MARESKGARAARAGAILTALAEAMPDARIELEHRTAYELLVAVILSAQCTDRRVNSVTPALFARFPDARALAAADASEVRPFIQSLGLYRAKAKNLVAAARALVAQHGGEVPVRRAQLAELAGVGNKTAGVVSMHIGGDVAFPVDTHVKRLAWRMGLTSAQLPDKVEADLQALLPPERWVLGHQLLVWHGRRTCLAREPACARCPVAALCPKRGVSATAGRPARARP